MFHEICLKQVYNLCLHNVWSLHPSDVCKVMTFSTHTLSIKPLTIHAHSCKNTHTYTHAHTFLCHLSLCCNQPSKRVTIILTAVFGYLSIRGHCCVVKHHCWQPHINLSYKRQVGLLFSLFFWMNMSLFSKKGADTSWCTIINYLLLPCCNTVTRSWKNVSHSISHEIWFYKHSLCALRDLSR